METKLLPSLSAAMKAAGLRDGMTISFHHHLRNGDYILNLVLEEAARMGVRDLTVNASSLFDIHMPIVGHIRNGVVTRLLTDYVSGGIGRHISQGVLSTPVEFRSHGTRAADIASGRTPIDIAFIGAPAADCRGNCTGKLGNAACGSLGYAIPDATYAKQVIVLTDTILPYPLPDWSISENLVDYVVQVEAIGDPKGILSGTTRITRDPVGLVMADTAARVIQASGLLQEGFSFQTGVGGPSLAANLFLEKYMDERGIKMGWAIGGICGPMVELLKKGKVGKVIDVQDFDLDAVNSINQTPNHFEMSASQYANPANKGAFVNKLDFVVLAALEIDTGFNVNVLTGSDGVIRGAIGGHPDTAEGASLSVVVAPLTRGRIPTIVKRVNTVVTTGDVVDVVVTDQGIAVNPRRPDVKEKLEKAGLHVFTIQQLQQRAEKIVGVPDPIRYKDRIVGVVMYRDNTIIDVVRQIDEDE